MLSKIWNWLKNIYNKIDPNHRWLLILVGALTMMFFWYSKHLPSSREQQYQTQIAAYKDTTKKLLDSNKVVEKANAVLVASADSIMKVKTLDEAKLAATVKQALATKKTQDAKIAQLQQEKAACVDICADWKTVALQEQVVTDSLKKTTEQQSSDFQAQKDAFGKLTTAYDNRGTEITRLAKQVANVPVYKPEKILWIIPLPSRKLSFVAGVLLGAAAIVAVK